MRLNQDAAMQGLKRVSDDLAAVVRYDSELLTEDELAVLSEMTHAIERIRFRLASGVNPKEGPAPLYTGEDWAERAEAALRDGPPGEPSSKALMAAQNVLSGGVLGFDVHIHLTTKLVEDALRAAYAIDGRGTATP